MLENRQFYEVVIDLPRIEYKVEGDNFTIIKSLSLNQISHLLN